MISFDMYIYIYTYIYMYTHYKMCGLCDYALSTALGTLKNIPNA